MEPENWVKTLRGKTRGERNHRTFRHDLGIKQGNKFFMVNRCTTLMGRKESEEFRAKTKINGFLGKSQAWMGKKGAVCFKRIDEL